MIFGYARVSTKDQDLSRQIDLLLKYDVDEIFKEKISGTKKDRPELNNLKNKLRSGDVVVVESFSRLGRSTKDLIDLVEFFQRKKVKLISVKENFDTTTPQGVLMLTVFQAFAQFERDLILERTNEGLKSARKRGIVGGRPVIKKEKVDKAIKMYESKQFSLKEIRAISGVSVSSLYRYLDKREKEECIKI